MRKTPIFSFLIPATVALASSFTLSSATARPLSREDLFGTSPIPGVIDLRPDDDPADSGMYTIPPEIARHLRPEIGPRLRFHPFFPDIDDDPPLPAESPDPTDEPEASLDPIPSVEPTDGPTVIGPVDGDGSPTTGGDNLPNPTGSIPQVQIPANAGGCSLQTSGGSGFFAAAALLLQTLWFWMKRSR